ncbi:MAG: DNA-binding response regulator [Bacteroidetes bacterium]|nr:MAG: DNA-binding response regulator [Gammaproteobacteria bacterium]RLD56235.1 MAG: DNA-binding response regulator [Bacteroidota bacterium]RLD94454.1 MAG: DNA-binding response regulator [Bacteroidota bacterium]RLE04827.1 MAG: DNA-binding response regulator [Bacteroidota bacterium]
MTDYKILIVDDEEDLCEILQFNLEGEGFETEVAYSAEEALTKDMASFHLILLDVMMGEMSGFKLAKLLRKEQKLSVPIIFITAKTAEDELLTGFSLGADDYITKPFSIKEVIVRVKAVLKRSALEERSELSTLAVDKLVLNLKKRKVKIGKKELELTRKEFEILAMLLKSEGYFHSREEILDRVWDDNTIVSKRTVDVHVAHLRKKLGSYGKYIRNKQGYGYTFEKK